MPGESLNPARRAALFGKLPAHGDFVRRGDAALARRLDAWLTSGVERVAAAAGDAYAARMARLPTWAFALPDGTAGAVAASHDRVGRIFPVAAMMEGGGAAGAAVAAALGRAIDERLDADALFAALPADADGAAPDETPAGGRWWRSFEPGQPTVAFADLPAGADFARLLEGVG